MKFTSQVPTKDGYYLWRLDINFREYVVTIENGYTEAGVLPPHMSGEWCPLVPLDECRHENEIKEAFIEASPYEVGSDLFKQQWEQSRAKRVMEGPE